MKTQKIILPALMFCAVFLAVVTDAFAQKTLAIKLVEKPAVISAGQRHTFVFNVRNISGAPLTLSSRCAASAKLLWDNGDGTGGGAGTGCGDSITMVTSTDYDMETGKFNCVTRVLPNLPYNENDFFTLQPNEAKRFTAEVFAPRDVTARFAMALISYESKHDGSAVGLRAWTGAADSVKIKMRVVR